MAIKFTNNAVGTLALSISDIETSISVSGTEGSKFPTLTGSDYFYATLVDADGNREIIKVTARTGNTMTVERGQEGTSARAFDAGSKLSHRLTAAALNEFVEAHESFASDTESYRADTSGNLVTGGTATAYTLTTNQDFDSLTDGILVTARMHATSGEEPTLNVDGLGAKQIRVFYGTNVPIGALIKGAIYSFTYDSTDDAWIARGVVGAAGKYVGEVFDFAGSVAPAGCLFCYGQAVSRTTYAALFAVIGTTYGSGNGSTTFNLPDCRGRVVAGKDDMGGTSANRLTNQSGSLNGDTLGATGGAETHTLTTSQLPAHTHGAGSYFANSSGAHTHNFTYSIRGADAASDPWVYQIHGSSHENTVTTQSSGAHTHTISGTSGSTGSGSAHNNVQPTIIMNKCIYVGA